MTFPICILELDPLDRFRLVVPGGKVSYPSLIIRYLLLFQDLDYYHCCTLKWSIYVLHL